MFLLDTQILRATHKLADHCLRKNGTKKVDPFLVVAAICTAINGALRINMLVFGLVPDPKHTDVPRSPPLKSSQ